MISAIVFILALAMPGICPARADRIDLIVSGKRVASGTSSVIVNQTVYIPSAALGSIGAFAERIGLRSGDYQNANVVMRDGRRIPCKAQYMSSLLMIPISDIASDAGIVVDWNAGANTVTIMATISSIEFDGSQLRLTTSYPVRYKVDFWKAMNRLVVQFNGAVFPSRESTLSIINSTSIGIRRGIENGSARIVMDMPNKIRFKTTSASLSSIITASIAGLDLQLPIGVADTVQPDMPAANETASQFVQPAPAPATVPATLATINNVEFRTEGADRINVIVSANNAVKYTTYMSRRPDRLVLNISDSILGEGVEDIPVDHDILRSIGVEQRSNNAVRITMELQRVVSYNVSQDALAGQTTVSLDLPKVAGMSISDCIVVIDPGHGGPTKVGARAANGMREKEITFAIAQRVQAALKESGARAFLTRNGDVELDSDLSTDLRERVEFAARNSADFFISIHCNAIVSPRKVSGTEIFYHGRDAKGRALAECILPEILGVTGLPDRKVRSDTSLYSTGLAVLRNSSERYGIPAILIETGFIDHPGDCGILCDPAYQQKIGEAIVRGLRVYIEGSAGRGSQVRAAPRSSTQGRRKSGLPDTMLSKADRNDDTSQVRQEDETGPVRPGEQSR